MIHWTCQSCGKKLRTADTDAGKTRPCPKCRAMILIPQPSDVVAVQEPERPVLPAPVPPTSGLDWRWVESTWPAASSVPISELDSDDPTEPDEDPFAADPFTEDIERLAAEVDREDAEAAALARNHNKPAPKQANGKETIPVPEIEPEPRQRGISLVAMFGISLFAVFFIGLPVVVIVTKSEFAEKVMRKLQPAAKQPEQSPVDAGVLADAQERLERLEKELRERGAQEKEREEKERERIQEERFQRIREDEQRAQAIPPLPEKAKEPTAKEWLAKGIEASSKRRTERPTKFKDWLDLDEAETDFLTGIKACGGSREEQLLKAEILLRLAAVRRWKYGADIDAASRAEKILRSTLSGPQEIAEMRNGITIDQNRILQAALRGK